MNIRPKITFALLAVALISVFLIAGTSLYLAKNYLIEARGQSLQALILGRRDSLKHILKSWKNQTSLVASRTQLRTLLAEHLNNPTPSHISKMNKILSDALKADQSLVYIGICDFSGNLVIETGFTMDKGFKCNESQTTSSTNSKYEKIWQPRSKETLHVQLSSPVILNSKHLAQIYVIINAYGVLEIAENHEGLGRTGEVLFARRLKENGNAQFITPLKHDLAGMFVRTVPKENLNIPMTQSLLRNELSLTAPSTVDYRGEPVIAATAYVPELDWGMVVKIDRSEAIEPIRRLAVTVFQFTLLISIIIIFIGIYIARSISLPISKLTRVSESIKSGDFTKRSKISTNDEIGILAAAYDEMLDALNEAKANAETAVKAKSKFLAKMTHEIKMPMNGILSAADLLISSNLNKDQKSLAEAIQISGSTLLELINDILDLSALESQRLSLALKPTNIHDMIVKLDKTFHITAKQAGVDFQTIIPKDLPELISCDEVRLQQILINLLGNAFKYTEQGHVRFRVEITNRTASNITLKFSIEDTGKGISEAGIPHLFQDFTQLELRRFNPEGTGLGLAISKLLIELMNGEINVQSVKDQGSIFWCCASFDIAAPPDNKA